MSLNTVVCYNVGCRSIGTKLCGSCGDASYCSVTCQKADWAAHKTECVYMNTKPSTFLNCRKLEKLYEKATKKSLNLEARKQFSKALKVVDLLLINMLSQYGTLVPDESCYIRADGSRMDNYIICHLRSRLSYLYECCPSDITGQNVVLANLVKLRDAILQRIREGKDMDRKMHSVTEKLLCELYCSNHLLQRAEFHGMESLIVARLYEGEDSTNNLCDALVVLARVRGLQEKHPEAIKLAEEAYLLASEANGLLHPLVQKVATQLIDCLISSRDLSKASDFCRINYENLIDPLNGIDPKSMDVACGMMQLAKIWIHNVTDEEFWNLKCCMMKSNYLSCYGVKGSDALSEGPEALRLARQALSIVETRFDSYSKAILPYLDVLFTVLSILGDSGTEVTDILHQIIAITAEFNGVRLSTSSGDRVDHLTPVL